MIKAILKFSLLCFVLVFSMNLSATNRIEWGNPVFDNHTNMNIATLNISTQAQGEPYKAFYKNIRKIENIHNSFNLEGRLGGIYKLDSTNLEHYTTWDINIKGIDKYGSKINLWASVDYNNQYSDGPALSFLTNNFNRFYQKTSKLVLFRDKLDHLFYLMVYIEDKNNDCLMAYPIQLNFLKKTPLHENLYI